MVFNEESIKPVPDHVKMQNFLSKKRKVPIDLLNKRKRILKLEQEGIFAYNILCPSSYRPYQSYAVSSNSVFELARIERKLSCNSSLLLPSLEVYKTQYKYTQINDHFSEQLIGRVQQRFTVFGRTLYVYEMLGTELILKYQVSCPFVRSVIDCVVPNSLKCSVRTAYFIQDVSGQNSTVSQYHNLAFSYLPPKCMTSIVSFLPEK